MLLMRIVACVLPGFVLAPTLAAGQQTPKQPASRIVEGTDVRGGWLRGARSARRVEPATGTPSPRACRRPARTAGSSRSEKRRPIIRAGSVVRTSAETSGFGTSGQRYPLETRDSIEDGSASGRVLRTDTTQRLDINGRLAISERSTEESSVTPEGRRSERTIRRPDLDRRLRPQERTEHTERRVAPQAVQATTTELGTDLDARWQVLEGTRPRRAHDRFDIGDRRDGPAAGSGRQAVGARTAHQPLDGRERAGGPAGRDVHGRRRPLCIPSHDPPHAHAAAPPDHDPRGRRRPAGRRRGGGTEPRGLRGAATPGPQDRDDGPPHGHRALAHGTSGVRARSKRPAHPDGRRDRGNDGAIGLMRGTIPNGPEEIVLESVAPAAGAAFSNGG